MCTIFHFQPTIFEILEINFKFIKRVTKKMIYRFGPGAGGASGGLLAVMPRSRAMVRRVAAVSGSPFAGNAIFKTNNRI